MPDWHIVFFKRKLTMLEYVIAGKLVRGWSADRITQFLTTLLTIIIESAFANRIIGYRL